jgi:hypothetical protein
MATKPKRPRDPFQLAKLIGDISTGEVADEDPNAGKNSAAVALGKLGGKARAVKLSQQERTESAKKAITARWAKKQAVADADLTPKRLTRRGVIRPTED